MARDLTVFSIGYFVCIVLLVIAYFLAAQLLENPPSGAIAMIVQVVASAATGQFFIKRHKNYPKFWYSLKVAFLTSLITIIMSTEFVFFAYVETSLYTTGTLTDALGFLWVMSGLAQFSVKQWVVVTLFLIPVITVINLASFWLGAIIMRLVLKRNARFAMDNGTLNKH